MWPHALDLDFNPQKDEEKKNLAHSLLSFIYLRLLNSPHMRITFENIVVLFSYCCPSVNTHGWVCVDDVVFWSEWTHKKSQWNERANEQRGNTDDEKKTSKIHFRKDQHTKSRWGWTKRASIQPVSYLRLFISKCSTFSVNSFKRYFVCIYLWFVLHFERCAAAFLHMPFEYNREKSEIFPDEDILCNSHMVNMALVNNVRRWRRRRWERRRRWSKTKNKSQHAYRKLLKSHRISAQRKFIEFNIFSISAEYITNRDFLYFSAWMFKGQWDILRSDEKRRKNVVFICSVVIAVGAAEAAIRWLLSTNRQFVIQSCSCLADVSATHK